MLESGEYIIALAIAAVVGLVTVFSILNAPPTSLQSTTSGGTLSGTTLSPASVAAHNLPSDCWTTIDGNVYNITTYLRVHPGGPLILQACGIDASALFHSKGNSANDHSAFAIDLLNQYLIGPLDTAGAQNASTIPATPPTPVQTPNTLPVQNSTLQPAECIDTLSAAQHNTIGDCWISIDSTVYDVTAYLSIHPGGIGAISPYCGGRDASAAFATKGGSGNTHSTYAKQTLQSYSIGAACAAAPQTTSQIPAVSATITAPLANEQLAADTSSTQLRVTTNTNATCKWSAADQTYSSMPNTFTTTGKLKHSTKISGLANGVQYTLYVRCQNTAAEAMQYSALVSFTVANPLPAGTVLDTATVALHNKQSDCWLVVSGNVYDVTAFLPVHPGGIPSITPFCGAADATSAFNTKNGGGTHSSAAKNLLASYLLGPLGTSVATNQTVNQTAPLTLTIASPSASQVFAAGSTSTTLAVITNRAANCRYSTANLAFSAMPSNSFATTGATTHSASLPITDGSSYTVTVRCQESTAQEASGTIAFSVQSAAPATSGTYTLADVALHATQSDCWLAINNKVYSVSTYIPIHPGGTSRIVTLCGKDATTAFNTKGGQGSHSNNAKNLLAGYYLGDLSGTTGGTNSTTPGSNSTGGTTNNLVGTTGDTTMDQALATTYPGATVTSSNIEDDGRAEIKINYNGHSITVKFNSQGQITGTG